MYLVALKTARWVESWVFVALVTLCLIGNSDGSTADSNPLPTLLSEGARALDEGLPQVAGYKLREFLKTNPASDQRREAVLTLARALLAVPDAAGSLTLLDREFPPAGPRMAGESVTVDAPVTFARAQALAGLGRWPEALENYTRATEAAGPGAAAKELEVSARFGRGEALLALDRQGEAAASFRPLGGHPRLGPLAKLRCAEIELDSKHRKDAEKILLDDAAPGSGRDPVAAKEHAYLVGRLRLAQVQPALARQIFADALARPEGLTERLLVDDYWGLAHACIDEDQPDGAQSALENLIAHYPRLTFLAPSFAWLESLYLRDTTPNLLTLDKWASDDAEPARQALARLTLGHVKAHVGDLAEAEEIFAGFVEMFPAHPLRTRALLDLASLRLAAGRYPEARAALTRARALASDEARWRTSIETLDARVALAEHDSVKAAEGFAAVAARLGTGPQAEAAAFNAVLASLRAPDPERFATVAASFRARFPHSALGVEFLLEEGLARADQLPAGDAVGRRRAALALREFVDGHPTHPRADEARIALAELHFSQLRPDVVQAWREIEAPVLRRVTNEPDSAPSPAERDRAEYLAIWLADAPGPTRDTDRAITLAKRFLERRPDSPLAAETRLKLGEIYFAREDYPDAQTQLELLAQNAPASPLAEGALYLAGRAAAAGMSATGLDRAVELFEKAAQRGGPLRLSARLRQAEVMAGRPDGGKDALTLYDGVLTETAKPNLGDRDLESRCAALGGRGQTLIALAASENNNQRYAEAVKTFNELAGGTPGASLFWRRQALTLKGHALEKLGDTDAALAAYSDALDATEASAGGEPGTPEWTWFYRAGNDAARLLESGQKWAAAIAIYKKVATADGPMKSEFESRLSRRRLEHFLWED